MTEEKLKNCNFRERTYPHGSEIGQSGGLIRCNNGNWESVVLISGI